MYMEEGFPEMVSEELMSVRNAKSRVWKTGDDRQAVMGNPQESSADWETTSCLADLEYLV